MYTYLIELCDYVVSLVVYVVFSPWVLVLFAAAIMLQQYKSKHK